MGHHKNNTSYSENNFGSAQLVVPPRTGGQELVTRWLLKTSSELAMSKSRAGRVILSRQSVGRQRKLLIQLESQPGTRGYAVI